MGAWSSFIKNSKARKEAGGITVMGLGGAVVDGGLTYGMERAEDPQGSVLVDGAQAVGTAAAWLLAEPLMWGITAGQAAVGAGKMVYEEAEENRQARIGIQSHVRTDATGASGGQLGGNFVDSQQAYTMRQRQMDVLRQHRIATESILGSEARQLHR